MRLFDEDDIIVAVAASAAAAAAAEASRQRASNATSRRMGRIVIGELIEPGRAEPQQPALAWAWPGSVNG